MKCKTVALVRIVYKPLFNRVTSSGAGLSGHHLGQIDSVDVYETESDDGKAGDILFPRYYHPRTISEVLSVYRLSKPGERPAFITYTDFRVDGSPYPTEAVIRERMRRELGFPVPPLNMAETLTFARFIRAPDQNAGLAEVTELGIGPAASYMEAGG